MTGFGPRRRSATAGVLAVALVALVAGCSSAPRRAPGPAHTPSEPPLGYRAAPSFLPSSSPAVDRVVTATATHSQLAVQGVPVQVDLPGGHALALVTGPAVPPFVAPPPPAVTATFTVTLTKVAGTVPIRLGDFVITDQLGRSFHPTLVAHETPPPVSAPSGPGVSFRLTAVMPTGEGRIYWSPTHAEPIVGWDFIVEND